jgi:hypothetical protein
MSIRGIRPGILTLAILLILAGCASFPNPLEAPPPPDALHPNVPAPAIQPPDRPSPDPVKVGELARHRAIWESRQIGGYSMTVIYGCVCALAGRPIQVTVTNGALASATDHGKPLDLASLTGFPATVDALFEYAERNADAGKIEFAWDEQFGLPTAVGIDPDLAKRDDEVRIAVLGFTPTR